MPSYDETRRLLSAAQQGSLQAKERLAEENIALVRSVVRRYADRGVEYDDLFQLGCIGLVKAIGKFDLSRDVCFSTYAVPMIMGEIRRFLRDDGPVKVSRQLKELNRAVLKTMERLERETGAPVGVNHIAEALHISAEDVALALEAPRTPVYLDAPIGDDDGSTRAELIPDRETGEGVVDRILVKELIDLLEPREKQIIVLRYFRDCTQRKVAEMIGVSQVQVSRLESRILKKLKRYASAPREDGSARSSAR